MIEIERGARGEDEDSEPGQERRDWDWILSSEKICQIVCLSVGGDRNNNKLALCISWYPSTSGGKALPR